MQLWDALSRNISYCRTKILVFQRNQIWLKVSERMQQETIYVHFNARS